MIIIGYVSNPNGTATWCWEAAHALAEAGKEVVVICSSAAVRPANTPFTIFIYDENPSHYSKGSFLRKIHDQTIGRVSLGKSTFAERLNEVLVSNGISAECYLFNIPSLLSPGLSIPQYVVAWAYPTNLMAYLGKIGKISGWKWDRGTLYTMLDAIGWYRKDWYAYRQAAGVLAVSKRLQADLLAKQVKAECLYPCTQIQSMDVSEEIYPKCRFVLSALDLQEPRKRIAWLLDVLAQVPQDKIEIHLIGQADEAFISHYRSKLRAVFFYGKLPRDKALEILKGKDVFLFGSSLDDWGYVQTEAMAHGLMVIAPDLSPFDEIVGDPALLFKHDSMEDLKGKISKVLNQNIFVMRKSSLERAKACFSRVQFSENFLKILKKK